MDKQSIFTPMLTLMFFEYCLLLMKLSIRNGGYKMGVKITYVNSWVSEETKVIRLD